jgi:hypothetical protein
MVNPAARAAGVSARSLFSGPRPRARKYASEELKRFWDEVTPRQSYTEFRSSLLGLPGDDRVRLAGNGRDFGL